MQFETLAIILWFEKWESKHDINLARATIEAMSTVQLLDLIGYGVSDLTQLLNERLVYGDAQGSKELREAIAARYENQSYDNVVATHSTAAANALVHRALVDEGDSVVAVLPGYRQHSAIPLSVGANVQYLELREADAWLPDLCRLRELATPGTKLIALSNPNNPTGALVGREMLEKVVAIARNCGAWLLCDEVNGGIDQEGSGVTPGVVDLYEKGISTGGISKSFALAGLRIGWVAAPSLVVDDLMAHRDHDTVSIGLIDDHIASLALKNSERILARSREMVRHNLAVLDSWIGKQPQLRWVRPRSGACCLVKIDLPINSVEFCNALAEDTGVLLMPGSILGMEGYVRLGFGIDREKFAEGLARISDFLAKIEDAQLSIITSA